MSELVFTREMDNYEIVSKIREQFGSSKIMKVYCEPIFEQRTERQNGLFQTWVKQICEQAGLYGNIAFTTKVSAENYLKEFLKEQACLHGYPYKTDNKGHKCINDKGEYIPCSTKEVCISDFKILLDTTYHFAVENGFTITERE